jgi:hypothetical protein
MNDTQLETMIRNQLRVHQDAGARAGFVKRVLNQGGEHARIMARLLATAEVDGGAPGNKAIGRPQSLD